MASIRSVLNTGENTCCDRNVETFMVLIILLYQTWDVFAWRIATRNIWQKANEGK